VEHGIFEAKALNARLFALSHQSGLNTFAEGIWISIEIDRVCAALPGKANELFDRISCTDDQSRTQ
jgi:hypothetical protein